MANPTSSGLGKESGFSLVPFFGMIFLVIGFRFGFENRPN
jgi:hypothetical protein